MLFRSCVSTTRLLARSIRLPTNYSYLNYNRYATDNFTSTENSVSPLLTYPSSGSYFTGNSKYYDLLTGLDQCIEKYTNLQPYYANSPDPNLLETLSEKKDTNSIIWLNQTKLSAYLKLNLTSGQHLAIVARLNRLVVENPNGQNLPLELQHYLENFSSSGQLTKVETKEKVLDEQGKSYEVGRRKESRVRVWLIKGDGQFLVNNKKLTDYFTNRRAVETAIFPFELTNTLNKYNVFSIATGGGTTGQSQALSLALSKALIIHQPELKSLLEQADLLYRDPRAVERKKTGQPKARKHNTWVKR